MTRSKTSLTEHFPHSCKHAICNEEKPSNKTDFPTQDANAIENVPFVEENGTKKRRHCCRKREVAPSQDIPSNVSDGTVKIEDNALERCKRNCERGIFDIRELLEVCEKDPDSILRAYRGKHTNDQNLPRSGSCVEDCYSDCDFPTMRQTHGEVFGDPKYHYLMVDATTSMDVVESVEKVHPVIMRRPDNRRVSVASQEDTRSEEIMIIPPTREPEASVNAIEVLQEARDSDSSEKSKTGPKAGPHFADAAAAADEEPAQLHERRHSNVSWSELLKLRNSEAAQPSATDSLEKVVIRATAKADKFRHNVNAKKHYSLLGDIVREEKYKTQDSRKSSTTETMGKEVAEPQSKRKFGFLKGRCSKKGHDKKAADEEHKVTEEESLSDFSDVDSKRRSGQSSIDSYKRRSSPVDNPVFETATEIDKYLNNA